MLELKRWDNGEVIHSGDFKNIKELVEDAVGLGISLYKANLYEANLYEANLIEANLYEANLIEANLIGAKLIEANLIGAKLIEANLIGANLIGANLAGANLIGTDLYRASLIGTDNYYSFTAYDTSKRIVHCVKHENTWMVQAGCFCGALEELEAKVKATHNSKVYLANIEILKGL